MKQILNTALLVSCYHAIQGNVQNLNNYMQYLRNPSIFCNVSQNINNGEYYFHAPEFDDLSVFTYVCSVQELRDYIKNINLDDTTQCTQTEVNTKAYFLPSVNQKFTCNAAGDDVILVCLYSSDSHIICNLADGPISYEIHYDEFKSNGYVFSPILSDEEKVFKSLQNVFKVCSDLGIKVCYTDEDEISEKTFYFSSAYYDKEDGSINLV